MEKTLYKAAKYIRLSYSDEKGKESESVENQRRILDAYIDSRPDIAAGGEYVDDGVSGIIFNRPAFKGMMTDIEDGRINCVVVKDLSRLGRDYIETGRYLRTTFPALGVRFIAIGDNIDTLTDRTDDLVVSVKSAVNDAYSRDISKKVRTALNAKRLNGDYVGACPVYGYRKDEGNHNKLVVDEHPAGIVRDIFSMKLDGMSALKISGKLNGLGVLSPLEYKKHHGLPHPKGGFSDKDGAKWSAKSVIRILSNETYAGTLVQDRQGTPNYKLKDVVSKPKSEWKRVENAHEAIISKHDYDLAQKIMRLDTRSAPSGEGVYMFSGILICDCCGSRMTRKTVPYKDVKHHYYSCPVTKKRGCKKGASIRESDLAGCILESIKAHIASIASLDEIIEKSGSRRIASSLAMHHEAQIQENEQKLEKCRGYKSSLYESLMDGRISKDDYRELKAKYNKEESELLDAIAALREKIEGVLAGSADRLRWMEHFRRFDGLAELDRRIVISLIWNIRISRSGEIAVTFNYQDEYRDALAAASLSSRESEGLKEVA
jgi:DNA invertase Pin-like site-specific DNA recombinase